jgi:hypothetical protein
MASSWRRRKKSASRGQNTTPGSRGMPSIIACAKLSCRSPAHSLLADLRFPHSLGYLTQRHMDLARSIQAVTEEIMLRLARHAYALTVERNLCLAGMERAKQFSWEQTARATLEFYRQVLES